MSPNVAELEIDGFDDILADLSDLEKGGGPLTNMVIDTMWAGLSVLEQNIDARTPVNIGFLRGGTMIQVGGTPPNIYGEVTNAVKYGLPVEYGRKPGKMPPVTAIEYWVKRKGIQFTRDGRKLTEREMAWAIAAHIAQHGTKGAFMFRDGFAASRKPIEALFDDLLDDLIREMAKA